MMLGSRSQRWVTGGGLLAIAAVGDGEPCLVPAKLRSI